MCIHGDKSQPERDWVLTGKHFFLSFLSSILKETVTILDFCHCGMFCVCRVSQWKSSNFDCH